MAIKKTDAGKATPSGKFRRGRIAAAAVAACAVGSLLFAPSAYANTYKNVMLTSVPAGTGSVAMFARPLPEYNWGFVGCFRVQAGRDTSTGFYGRENSQVELYTYGDSVCGGHQGPARAYAVRTLTGNWSNWWVDVP
jgi:hypothetical protein